MYSDADIMQRVQAGETAAFSLLVDRYQSRLLRFALSKVGHQEQAEDLVQDALLAAYQARDLYSPEFAFSTWIWTILLNLSRRTYRREHRQVELIQQRQAEPVGTGNPSPLDGLLAVERHEQLLGWLDQLPEAEGDAIRLRFLAEMSYEEIALTMASSVSGAKVRVKRGILKLTEISRNHLTD